MNYNYSTNTQQFLAGSSGYGLLPQSALVPSQPLGMGNNQWGSRMPNPSMNMTQNMQTVAALRAQTSYSGLPEFNAAISTVSWGITPQPGRTMPIGNWFQPGNVAQNQPSNQNIPQWQRPGSSITNRSSQRMSESRSESWSNTDDDFRERRGSRYGESRRKRERSSDRDDDRRRRSRTSRSSDSSYRSTGATDQMSRPRHYERDQQISSRNDRRSSMTSREKPRKHSITPERRRRSPPRECKRSLSPYRGPQQRQLSSEKELPSRSYRSACETARHDRNLPRNQPMMKQNPQENYSQTFSRGVLQQNSPNTTKDQTLDLLLRRNGVPSFQPNSLVCAEMQPSHPPHVLETHRSHPFQQLQQEPLLIEDPSTNPQLSSHINFQQTLQNLFLIDNMQTIPQSISLPVNPVFQNISDIICRNINFVTKPSKRVRKRANKKKNCPVITKQTKRKLKELANREATLKFVSAVNNIVLNDQTPNLESEIPLQASPSSKDACRKKIQIKLAASKPCPASQESLSKESGKPSTSTVQVLKAVNNSQASGKPGTSNDIKPCPASQESKSHESGKPSMAQVLKAVTNSQVSGKPGASNGSKPCPASQESKSDESGKPSTAQVLKAVTNSQVSGKPGALTGSKPCPASQESKSQESGKPSTAQMLKAVTNSQVSGKPGASKALLKKPHEPQKLQTATNLQESNKPKSATNISEVHSLKIADVSQECNNPGSASKTETMKIVNSSQEINETLSASKSQPLKTHANVLENQPKEMTDNPTLISELAQTFQMQKPPQTDRLPINSSGNEIVVTSFTASGISTTEQQKCKLTNNEVIANASANDLEVNKLTESSSGPSKQIMRKNSSVNNSVTAPQPTVGNKSNPLFPDPINPQPTLFNKYHPLLPDPCWFGTKPIRSQSASNKCNQMPYKPFWIDNFSTVSLPSHASGGSTSNSNHNNESFKPKGSDEPVGSQQVREQRTGNLLINKSTTGLNTQQNSASNNEMLTSMPTKSSQKRNRPGSEQRRRRRQFKERSLLVGESPTDVPVNIPKMLESTNEILIENSIGISENSKPRSRLRKCQRQKLGEQISNNLLTPERFIELNTPKPKSLEFNNEPLTDPTDTLEFQKLNDLSVSKSLEYNNEIVTKNSIGIPGNKKKRKRRGKNARQRQREQMSNSLLSTEKLTEMNASMPNSLESHNALLPNPNDTSTCQKLNETIDSTLFQQMERKRRHVDAPTTLNLQKSFGMKINSFSFSKKTAVWGRNSARKRALLKQQTTETKVPKKKTRTVGTLCAIHDNSKAFLYFSGKAWPNKQMVSERQHAASIELAPFVLPPLPRSWHDGKALLKPQTAQVYKQAESLTNKTLSNSLPNHDTPNSELEVLPLVDFQEANREDNLQEKLSDLPAKLDSVEKGLPKENIDNQSVLCMFSQKTSVILESFLITKDNTEGGTTKSFEKLNTLETENSVSENQLKEMSDNQKPATQSSEKSLSAAKETVRENESTHSTLKSASLEKRNEEIQLRKMGAKTSFDSELTQKTPTISKSLSDSEGQAKRENFKENVETADNYNKPTMKSTHLSSANSRTQAAENGCEKQLVDDPSKPKQEINKDHANSGNKRVADEQSSARNTTLKKFVIPKMSSVSQDHECLKEQMGIGNKEKANARNLKLIAELQARIFPKSPLVDLPFQPPSWQLIPVTVPAKTKKVKQSSGKQKQKTKCHPMLRTSSLENKNSLSSEKRKFHVLTKDKNPGDVKTTDSIGKLSSKKPRLQEESSIASKCDKMLKKRAKAEEKELKSTIPPVKVNEHDIANDALHRKSEVPCDPIYSVSKQIKSELHDSIQDQVEVGCTSQIKEKSETVTKKGVLSKQMKKKSKMVLKKSIATIQHLKDNAIKKTKVPLNLLKQFPESSAQSHEDTSLFEIEIAGVTPQSSHTSNNYKSQDSSLTKTVFDEPIVSELSSLAVSEELFLNEQDEISPLCKIVAVASKSEKHSNDASVSASEILPPGSFGFQEEFARQLKSKLVCSRPCPASRKHKERTSTESESSMSSSPQTFPEKSIIKSEVVPPRRKPCPASRRHHEDRVAKREREDAILALNSSQVSTSKSLKDNSNEEEGNAEQLRTNVSLKIDENKPKPIRYKACPASRKKLYGIPYNDNGQVLDSSQQVITIKEELKSLRRKPCPASRKHFIARSSENESKITVHHEGKQLDCATHVSTPQPIFENSSQSADNYEKSSVSSLPSSHAIALDNLIALNQLVTDHHSPSFQSAECDKTKSSVPIIDISDSPRSSVSDSSLSIVDILT